MIEMLSAEKQFIALTIVLLFVFVLSGCEKESDNSNAPDFEYVSYGTSFGECLGYCRHAIIVSENQIDFSKNGWDTEGLLPEVTMHEYIDNVYWETLVDKISYHAFFQLDSIIGCPDCVDGGAEWVEIKCNGKTHKVVFEYKNAPEVLQEFVTCLRTYMLAFQVYKNEYIHFDNQIFINHTGKIKIFVATRGTHQYLIEIIGENDTIYYYPEYLDVKYRHNNLDVVFSGVLKYDSTLVYKPAPNDAPIPDFKARNIYLSDVKILN